MSNTPDVMQNPLTNKGTAFTADERAKYGLTGRLPVAVETLDQQAARAYRQFASYEKDMEKYIFLDQLHNRNEVLYYKLLTDHLAEMLPIVYDPTVGEAIKQWSRDYRRSRAVYLDVNHPENIRASFATLGLGADDVDLLVVSDAEEILGIGDWGVNGTDISVGKLAVYTAAAGIHPARTIAVNLDVGTDNEALLNDPDYQQAYARPAAEVAGWQKADGKIGLLEVVKQVKPTILIGTSTDHGAFTEAVIKALCAGVERPILLPLSNPTERIEVMPADAIAWSDGKALLSVGIPVPPVPYKGVNYVIGQANNAMLYPGLGLGVIVSGAKHVTDGMLLAAAEAVASQVNPQDVGASLLPPVDNLRASSATVAVAVAKQAVKDGVATKQSDNWVQTVQDAMWQAEYQ